jgi:hypothetical protein
MAFTPIRVRESMLGQVGVGDLAFEAVQKVVFSD